MDAFSLFGVFPKADTLGTPHQVLALRYEGMTDMYHMGIE